MNMTKPLYVVTMGIAVVFSLLSVVSLNATPLRHSKKKGTLHWQDNKKITVYLKPDPDGKNRHLKAKEGIESWGNEQALKDKGISIEVKLGDPPAGATNFVTAKWVPKDDASLNGKLGMGGVYEKQNSTEVDEGVINLSRDTNQVDDQMAKNLAMHEMGHVLGLDDVNKDGTANPNTAMDPDFDKTTNLKIGSNDSKELKANYGANQTDTTASILSTTTSIGGGMYNYLYTVDWLGGAQLALFEIETNVQNCLILLSLPVGKWENQWAILLRL